MTTKQGGYAGILGIPEQRGKTRTPLTIITFHGSDDPNLAFDNRRGTTAKHIYTSENPEEAKYYGKHLYTVHAKPKKLLDLTNFDPSNLRKLNSAAKYAGVIDKYYPFEDFLNDFADGQLYQRTGSQRTQNAVMDELLAKHDAVRIPDFAVGGGIGSSLVFRDPSLLTVVRKE